MGTLRHVIVSGLAISLFITSWCFAGEGHEKTAIYQMAEIMHRLKHYPSPQGKKELQAIIDASSTSVYERVIARAIMNLEHQPIAQDIPLLKKIVNNKTAKEAERTIASIVLNLNHRPTKQDKNRLQELMK